MPETTWYILFAALALDLVFGDPEQLPHPVVMMGRVISYLEPVFRQRIEYLLLSGILFAFCLISATWLAGFLILRTAEAVHPWAGAACQVVLLFYCFSAKSLEKEAMAVYAALNRSTLDAARKAVARIVGRQTRDLDRPAITRAAVETVAENFVDGFLSPLFYFCIGGVPLALAYKMVNTLDSMVGYRNEKYLLFGRGAARIDDAANFVPARLSILFISLSAMLLSVSRGKKAFQTGLSDGRCHKSPNAGYPEAAFSGALQIRLGGPSIYHGKVVEKPLIGSRFQNPEPIKIKQACELMLLSSLTASFAAGIILFAG